MIKSSEIKNILEVLCEEKELLFDKSFSDSIALCETQIIPEDSNSFILNIIDNELNQFKYKINVEMID